MLVLEHFFNFVFYQNRLFTWTLLKSGIVLLAFLIGILFQYLLETRPILRVCSGEQSLPHVASKDCRKDLKDGVGLRL